MAVVCGVYAGTYGA